MNNSPSPFNPQELHGADKLNAALDAMKEGSSPEMFSADPTFQTLVHLHAQTSDHEADEEFVDDIEQLMLARFAHQQTGDRVRHSFWRTWTMPLVSLAMVAGIVVGISSDSIPLNVQGLRQRLSQLQEDAATNILQSGNTNTAVANANTNSTTNVNTDDSVVPVTITPLPTVTDVPGLAALEIEDDMAEIELVKKEIEGTMLEMEAFAADMDALNDANDVETLLNDFESLNL